MKRAGLITSTLSEHSFKKNGRSAQETEMTNFVISNSKKKRRKEQGNNNMKINCKKIKKQDLGIKFTM